MKADYYRRAVEGAEKMDKQPEYNVTFSIPLKEGNESFKEVIVIKKVITSLKMIIISLKEGNYVIKKVILSLKRWLRH